MIVSYNVRRYLADCLESLAAGYEGLSAEVFVVDNASSDGSADLLAHRFPAVRLLLNSGNFGFARAVNRALGLARGRYVLLLNPDTVVVSRALTQLVNLGDRWPEAGILAPTLRDPATGAVRSPLKPFPSWRSLFIRYTLAKPLLRLLPAPRWVPEPDRATIVGWVSGACLLIRRDLLDTIGGLNEKYFMWCEDTDYCRRAIQTGWCVFYSREISVFHHKGKSTEQEPPSAVLMQQLQSLFHYLEGDRPRASRRLKPLFKILFLGNTLYQLLVDGAKMIVYGTVGPAAKATKYRRRLEQDAGFLRRFTVQFLLL